MMALLTLEPPISAIACCSVPYNIFPMFMAWSIWRAHLTAWFHMLPTVLFQWCPASCSCRCHIFISTLEQCHHRCCYLISCPQPRSYCPARFVEYPRSPVDLETAFCRTNPLLKRILMWYLMTHRLYITHFLVDRFVSKLVARAAKEAMSCCWFWGHPSILHSGGHSPIPITRD